MNQRQHTLLPSVCLAATLLLPAALALSLTALMEPPMIARNGAS
jgi:hypothetical protein